MRSHWSGPQARPTLEVGFFFGGFGPLHSGEPRADLAVKFVDALAIEGAGRVCGNALAQRLLAQCRAAKLKQTREQI